MAATSTSPRPSRPAPWPGLIEDVCGFDPVRAWDDGTLEERARQAGVELQPGLGPGTVFNEVYEQKVERTLFDPTFVLDYPAEVSPLARRRRDDPRFVERFELVVAGRELANAFSELNDPIDQRARFEEQARRRELGEARGATPGRGLPGGDRGRDAARPAAWASASTGWPCCSPTAPGIRDVLLFPTMRPPGGAEADA